MDYINGPWADLMGSSLADFACWLEALCGPIYGLWFGIEYIQNLVFTIENPVTLFEKKVIHDIIYVLGNQQKQPYLSILDETDSI